MSLSGRFVSTLFAVSCFSIPLPAQTEASTQFIAGRRAAEVVRTVAPDSLLGAYPAILDFMTAGSKAFGQIHPQAPAETTQYGRLVGAWYIENHALFKGQWYCCWNAVWAWRYILNGFGVQDLWVQLEADLPPTVQYHRENTLTQLRVYQPDAKEWSVAFITNGGAEAPAGVRGGFRSYADGEAMIMEPEPAPTSGAPRTRIVFDQISKERFRWRRQQSDDDGGTWATTFLINARRIPVDGS